MSMILTIVANPEKLHGLFIRFCKTIINRLAISVTHICILMALELPHRSKPEEAVSSYKERWQIETAFKAMKTNGFNIEDTHLADIDRIERLFAVMIIAFTWAYLVGIYKYANFSNTAGELIVSSSMDWKKLRRHFQTRSKREIL